MRSATLSSRSVFLSTPSARRATSKAYIKKAEWLISIHALREEGDATSLFAQILSILFLSTPSARRATTSPWFRGYNKEISIHALREEGDHPLCQTEPLLLRISIHALREEGDGTL